MEGVTGVYGLQLVVLALSQLATLRSDGRVQCIIIGLEDIPKGGTASPSFDGGPVDRWAAEI